MLHAFKLIIIIFISSTIYSQSFVYSKNYFRWPVDIKPGIVANFGELREGHWHMGLDIRTDRKVNVPVHAAADGYIAKVTVHAFGYGQAIYINHPNGLTTVYGHLNKFFPALDSFVMHEQYKQHSWELELDFSSDQFPVRKGDFVALSGSTGSSQGPHVHFEIRDSKTNRCINPFLFTFPIADDVAPTIEKLAMYDRSQSVYDQRLLILPVTRAKGGFSLKTPLVKTGLSKLSFGVGAHDVVTGATNPNGIYGAEIFVDGARLIAFHLDSMDYDETDYVNAHVDYKYKYQGGTYIQELFKLPGDRGPAYRENNGDGTITLKDTNIHSIRIRTFDAKNNSSEIIFRLQHDDRPVAILAHPSLKKFVPNTVNIFEQNHFEVYLPDDCMYDTVSAVYDEVDSRDRDAVSPICRFGDPSVPVHNKMYVRLKPDRPLDDKLKDHVLIKRSDNRSASYRKAQWQLGWLAATFNNFGAFQAFVDSIPPGVDGLAAGDTVDLSGSTRIVLKPHDNNQVKSLRAELDGQWLRFTNDKGAAWIYNFDAHCPDGVHRLNVIVEDIAGNISNREWYFKKFPKLKSTIKKGKPGAVKKKKSAAKHKKK